MDRRAFGILAITLILLMAIVAVAGLDKLPRELRSSVQAAAAQVQSDRSRFDENRAAIGRAIAADPELFRAQAALWRERLDRAQSKLSATESQAATLKTVVEENRREDREKVEQGLTNLRSLRGGAVEESARIRREAEQWLANKRNLPGWLEEMRKTQASLAAWDAAEALKPAQAAMADWPAKRDELQGRIDKLIEAKKSGETAWEATSAARPKAEAEPDAAIDYAALFAAGARLQASLKEVNEGTTALNALAGQLYVDRNKALLELDGDDKRQKVRVVETTYPDSALKNGRTNEQERWEPADESRLPQLANHVGMVIERKPPGQFDSEADRTPQAPAYAYVAPVGQSNRYGSWSNGVWHWLPQYIILGQLLRGSQYPPITSGDYRGYESARRRGDVWYGRDGRYQRTWSGGRSWSGRGSAARRILDGITGSARGARGWYSERPSGGMPEASRSGGFAGSRYQSRGGFSGSRYQSRGGFGSRSYSRGFARSFGRALARGGRR
jgi:hypothetical protein